MKKLIYEAPGLDRIQVSAEHGFAASAGTNNWFENDMSGGSSQVEVVVPPEEEQWG